MRAIFKSLIIISLLSIVSISNGRIGFAQTLKFKSINTDLTIIVHQVKATKNNNSNGTIEFEIAGGFGDYSLKILGPGLKNISPNPNKTVVLENLRKGIYTIAVEDEVFNFSYKRIEVK